MLMSKCPFCGYQPDDQDPDFCYPTNRERTLWQAGCIEHKGGCTATVLGSTKEEAINHWNTRLNRISLRGKING